MVYGTVLTEWMVVGLCPEPPPMLVNMSASIVDWKGSAVMLTSIQSHQRWIWGSHRWGKYTRDLPWLWNLGQTSPEVHDGFQWPQKELMSSKFLLKKGEHSYSLQLLQEQRKQSFEETCSRPRWTSKKETKMSADNIIVSVNNNNVGQMDDCPTTVPLIQNVIIQKPITTSSE